MYMRHTSSFALHSRDLYIESHCAVIAGNRVNVRRADRADHVLPLLQPGSTIKCILDCDVNTFAYSVDGGAPVVAFEDLPAGRVFFPCVSLVGPMTRTRMLDPFYYCVPHVGFVLRTRVMCQAGRARAAGARRRGSISAWLCERAPLWVVVHVCMLLRLE
jgi:hypothetical protein